MCLRPCSSWELGYWDASPATAARTGPMLIAHNHNSLPSLHAGLCPVCFSFRVTHVSNMLSVLITHKLVRLVRVTQLVTGFELRL